MKPLSNYKFLLGGNDLEMQTIAELLSDHFPKEMILNENLSWGAKLSSYQENFDDIHTFVGIELTRDIKPPKKYIEIDHHNEKSHLPSSIEQVAETLGIELNRWQQLVAANDRGYIPAMESMDANIEEINKIRFQDRKAQGVTIKDEELAEKSIKENLEEYGELIALESLTARFSTITDRLYPVSKLIITHHDQLVYYGKGIKLLSLKFDNLVKEKKAFYGGGDIGFFGIARENYTSTQIIEMKKQIIDLTKCL